MTAQRFRTQPHHVFMRTFGNLNDRDRCTEWWTVTNDEAFYRLRDAIPFTTLYCNDGPGGLVVYLDRPKVAA